MSTSRVSTAQMYSNAQGHVATARDREQVSGEKAATQKEINRPSQDPSGWMQSNSLRDDQSVRETISKNAQVVSGTSSELTRSSVRRCGKYDRRARRHPISRSCWHR